MKVFAMATAVLLVGAGALAQEKPRGTPLMNADLIVTFASGAITIGDWPQVGASDARLFWRGGIVHAFYSDPDGNGNSTQGSWRIEQDTLCVTLQVAYSPGCASIYKLADGSYESWLGGKRIYVFRVKPPPIATAMKPAG